MSDDHEGTLPYRAEYAKSGRSNCKSCKTSIGKDTLRLATIVQSPVYDGLVPNWFHFACFFTKQRPKSVADIAHYDSLRWEDQEKIKNKLLEVNGSAPEPTKGGKKGTKRAAEKTKNSAFKDFTVEYAKSSRAMCRGCEIKLPKDEIRVSKKDFESENARRYGGQDRWHHLDCFAKLREDLEFFESGEHLPGYDSLKDEDKLKVKNALPKIDSKTVKDEADGAPPEKKVKSESSKEQSKQEKALKDQNKKMYKYRDLLKTLTRPQLSELLAYNKQDDPVGNDRRIDRLSDIMTFGALKPCETCKGQYVYCFGVGYKCTGDLSEWSKCERVEQDPPRKEFKVPEKLAEQYPFLEKYKCKLGTRLVMDVKPSTSKSENGETKKIERFAPFRDMSFFVIGKNPLPQAELKKKIVNLGGTLVSKLTPDVALVISTKEEVEKMSSKMSQVKDYDIHVVPLEYLDSCTQGDAVDKIKEMSISNWGADPEKRIKEIMHKSMMKSKSSSAFMKKSGSKVTIKVKGGSAVDPDSKLEDEAHVYKDAEGLYNSILGLSDVQNNKNSYYKLQLLASDRKKEFYVWRAWGRIGTTIGGNKLHTMKDITSAKELFNEIFYDQTGNKWKHRENFKKVPGRMYPVDVDYGENDIQLSEESKVESKLAKQVQDLVSLLFDTNTMKKVMMELELDLEKMPLGKLSRKQIQKAYAVLAELQAKDGDLKPDVVIDASNRFYTLIPHAFGTNAPPRLDNKEIIQAKLEMLESLLEMEIAYNLMKETKGEGDESQHPLDAHYAKLNTNIEVLPRDSEEFKRIETYVKNTHAETHSNYSLEILEVFKANRNGEDKRYKPFKKLPNKKLLWHGSRITNFAGILSQGLRIAPPEAPVTGYMFGKGVYFADMVSKSANYCMTSRSNPEGLLLLCEVALGNMYERTRADYIEKLPAGKHSTKGLGSTEPDPSASLVTDDGVEIPLGKGVKANVPNTSLLYNEYIVYDVAQVKVEYLLKMKFKY